MTAPLLATKFYIPPATPDRVDRPRLIRRLDEGLLPGRPLILICAPAGYGKTSLLSEWISSQPGKQTRFAWISLEAADNDPVRFFAYLAAALEKHIPGASALIDDLLAAPQPPASTSLAAGLVNPLAGCPHPLVIVLDDYQVIHERDLHAALIFLIEHLPPSIHLLISTRSDPPFPLHRLRARGQMVELRLDELRFTREETGRFLTPAIQAGLAEQDLTLLEQRTEGWAAGLRMVLLSVHGLDDLGAFLRNLSGSNRYILDYLAEEALHNQTQAIQAFLLQTAILDRQCAPLCDALTGLSNGSEMLAELERANCFLIPLDESRTWYRYHHLFADLLRVRLKQHAQSQPGLIAQLHRQAGDWLAENQCSEEAVQHYIQAGDFSPAAQIVERSTIDLFARGRLHQLLAWIRLLPDDLAEQRPWLNIYQAWTLAFAGRLPQAEQRLAWAEAGLPGSGWSTADLTRFHGEMRAIRSLITIMAGNISAALALPGLPDDIVPPEAGFARSVQRWAVGYALRIQGDLPGSQRAFEEVLQIGYDLDNLWTIVSASVDLGAILRRQGDLRRSEAVFRSGLERAYQASGGPGFVGRLEAFLAFSLCERGEFEEANRLIQRALTHNQDWENPNHSAYAWMVKARLTAVQNQPAEAAAALDAAEVWVAKGLVLPTLRAAVEKERVRFWLATGALQQARDWLNGQQISALPQGAPFSEVDDVRCTTAARVLLASAKPGLALELLAPLVASARRGGRLTVLIEGLLLQACAEPATSTGAAALRESLSLGLPRGFRQVFLDEVSYLANTLQGCQDIPGVSTLLTALPSQPTHLPLDSPLTAREVEILGWVAAGLSNPEIGARLYISAGTVKAHTAAIYRKLDVANRAEAIAKAKDLGLL